MPTSAELLTLVLKPREEARLLKGYRWVFSNELAAVPKDAEPGALAKIVTAKGRMMGLGFFNPKSLISFRLLAREPLPIDAAFFKRRLEEARDYRVKLWGEASAYRLCHGEGDGLPGLIIDRYGDVFTVDIQAAGMERLLPLIQGALEELFKPRVIYLKISNAARRFEGLTRESGLLLGEAPGCLEIEEDGVRYSSDPCGGGFGFDQRENRAAMKGMFKHASVLDLFSGSGAFGVFAAAHGAARVFGVDGSAPAVELAAASAKLNGVESKCEYRVGDPEEALATYAAAKGGLPPDVVFLSPPNLAPSKKLLGRALRHYQKLAVLGLRALKRGGLLAFSVPSPHVHPAGFSDLLRDAGAQAQKAVRVRRLSSQAQDHPVLLSMPESRHLSFALLEVV